MINNDRNQDSWRDFETYPIHVLSYNRGIVKGDYDNQYQYVTNSNAGQATYDLAKTKTTDILVSQAAEVYLLQEVGAEDKSIIPQLKFRNYEIIHLNDGSNEFDSAIALKKNRFDNITNHSIQMLNRDIAIALATDKLTNQRIVFVSAHPNGFDFDEYQNLKYLNDTKTAGLRVKRGDNDCRKIVTALTDDILPSEDGTSNPNPLANSDIQIVGIDINATPEVYPERFSIFTNKGFTLHRTNTPTNISPPGQKMRERELDYFFVRVVNSNNPGSSTSKHLKNEFKITEFKELDKSEKENYQWIQSYFYKNSPKWDPYKNASDHRPISLEINTLSDKEVNQNFLANSAVNFEKIWKNVGKDPVIFNKAARNLIEIGKITPGYKLTFDNASGDILLDSDTIGRSVRGPIKNTLNYISNMSGMTARWSEDLNNLESFVEFIQKNAAELEKECCIEEILSKACQGLANLADYYQNQKRIDQEGKVRKQVQILEETHDNLFRANFFCRCKSNPDDMFDDMFYVAETFSKYSPESLVGTVKTAAVINPKKALENLSCCIQRSDLNPNWLKIHPNDIIDILVLAAKHHNQEDLANLTFPTIWDSMEIITDAYEKAHNYKVDFSQQLDNERAGLFINFKEKAKRQANG